MANDRLRIPVLRKHFEDKQYFTRYELKEFYAGINSNLKETTFRWMLYELKDFGVIKSPSRGIYALIEVNRTEKNNTFDNKSIKRYAINGVFKPLFNDELNNIEEQVRSQYPHLKICIWSTSWLNEFTIHQTFRSFTIVEVEREAEESVYYYLSNVFPHVYLKPSKKEYSYYVNSYDNSIVVKPMTSESPLFCRDNICTPKIEKVLVDLLSEKVIFNAYQGQELINIFGNAFGAYVIDVKTMLRYAKRRNKSEKLIFILKEINMFDRYSESINI